MPFLPGAVVGATVTLVGSYLAGVQRKYEEVLSELVEEDMLAAWSNPTRRMHEAAEICQRRFRCTNQNSNTPNYTSLPAIEEPRLNDKTKQQPENA